MNLLLLSVLNRLAEKTRTFLGDPDADLEQWEAYMSQRSVLLLELETIPCLADDLADPAAEHRERRSGHRLGRSPH